MWFRLEFRGWDGMMLMSSPRRRSDAECGEFPIDRSIREHQKLHSRGAAVPHVLGSRKRKRNGREATTNRTSGAEARSFGLLGRWPEGLLHPLA